MLRMLTTITIIAVAVVSVPAAIVVAAEFEGTVSAMDDKGMATIKTTDGKEYKEQIAGGEGRGQGGLSCRGGQDVLP
jgi:hypothetical protein